MKSYQKDHLLSLYRTLKRLVEEVEDAAVRGRSPSGSGQALPPLPSSEWEAIREPLQRLLGQARALTADLAPEELGVFEQIQSVDRTRSWIALLLGRIGDLFEDLEPGVIARRFGEVTPEASEILERRLDSIEDAWQQATEIFGRTGDLTSVGGSSSS